MQHVEISYNKLIIGLETRWTPILDSIHDDNRINCKSSMGEKEKSIREKFLFPEYT